MHLEDQFMVEVAEFKELERQSIEQRGEENKLPEDLRPTASHRAFKHLKCQEKMPSPHGQDK